MRSRGSSNRVIETLAQSSSAAAGFNHASGDGDGVPDGCDNCPTDIFKTAPGVCGCGVSDLDLDGDAIKDCLDPVVAEGCRYVAVTPSNDAAVTGSVALRLVSPDLPCLFKYIDLDVPVDGLSVGKLVTSPVYRTAAAWGTVHVTGLDVVPNTTYEIKYNELGQAAAVLGSSRTPIWGDVCGPFIGNEPGPPDGTVDIRDILCAQDADAGVATAVPFPRADLIGWLYQCPVNNDVDAFDVQVVTDAFSGIPYSCPVPCE